MLTYLPLYFQGGLGFAPQKAGVLMLPRALPLFIAPRVVAKYWTHRLSGRALLCLGLGLVSAGMLWLGSVPEQFHFPSMLGGMMVAGIGAGVLNGETAKVSMTAIPPERAGMAAGVGGTVRFAGVVTGFAALGAILFSRVVSSLRIMLPNLHDAEVARVAQRVVAGDLSGAVNFGNVALLSFGAGYKAIFFAAASFAGVCASLSWLHISPSETAPAGRHATLQGEPVLPGE